MKPLLALFVLAGMAALAAPSYPQARIDAEVAKYQHLLRLDDYEIDAAAATKAEIDAAVNGSAWAYSHTDDLAKAVYVRVLDASEYAAVKPAWTDQQVEDDITDSIVHELVHVRLKAYSSMVRDFINQIEDADAARSAARDARKIEEAIVVRLTKALLAAR